MPPQWEPVEESHEYRRMRRTLSKGTQRCRDLLHETYGLHPVTYADLQLTPGGLLVPAETALTDPDDYFSLQSLDYIFELCFSKEAADGPIQVARDSARVEPYFVSDLPFTQLSDHYAVRMTLRYAPLCAPDE